MHELGPLLQPLGITATAEEGIWTISMDESTTLFLDYNVTDDRLTLSAEVGQPPASERAEAYQHLLMESHQWHKLKGIRFGLDDTDGKVVQLYDLPASNPDLASLQSRIGEFLAALTTWRDYLASLGSVDTPTETLAYDPRLPGGGGIIRG